MDEIVNRVAKSGLISLDLKDYCDEGVMRAGIDLKDVLFEGLILREKDFREYIRSENWSDYEGQYVFVYCSTDAVIPQWAWMLLASSLEEYASKVVFGDLDQLNFEVFKENFHLEDLEKFRDGKIVIKGCGEFKVPEACFLEATMKLKPLVSSIMYGEPCSTVPVYKKKKTV